MNIKKIGLTALATSLVASSAYAADVSVSGSAGFVFATKSGGATGGGATDHGKGFGVDNALSFSASGEMDNGWSVSASTALTDAAAVSSNNVTLTMGSLGSVFGGYGNGGQAGNYDGIAGAYEEVDDGGQTLSSNLVGSQFDNGGIFYTAPAIDASGATVQIHLGYTPKANDVALAGGVTDGTAGYGSAKQAGMTISTDLGLTVGVFAQTADRESTAATVSDAFAGTMYAKYAMGPVSIGYLTSYSDYGTTSSAEAAIANKVVGTAAGIFESEEYVIAFNVNDNLSVSYAKSEDTYDAQAGASAGSTTSDAIADVSVDNKSIQAAYSLGSMSIKAYRQESSNRTYSSTAGSSTKNEIALGLTF